MAVAQRILQPLFAHPVPRLLRLDKPVGTLLLLWPSAAALLLGAQGGVPWRWLGVFALGSLLARSGGCVVNDLADRGFDAQVRRTAQRPLARGELRPAAAVALALLCGGAALVLVLPHPRLTLAALAGAGLALAYPFAKRVMPLPQLVLAVAFSWGVPMAWVALDRSLAEPQMWLLLLGCCCWVVAYDTQYATSDRSDDIRLGLGSSAVFAGRHLRAFVLGFQALALLCWALLLPLLAHGWAWAAALLAAALLFLRQDLLLRRGEEQAQRCFRSNQWVGLALFAGAAAEAALSAGGPGALG